MKSSSSSSSVTSASATAGLDAQLLSSLQSPGLQAEFLEGESLSQRDTGRPPLPQSHNPSTSSGLSLPAVCIILVFLFPEGRSKSQSGSDFGESGVPSPATPPSSPRSSSSSSSSPRYGGRQGEKSLDPFLAAWLLTGNGPLCWRGNITAVLTVSPVSVRQTN